MKFITLTFSLLCMLLYADCFAQQTPKTKEEMEIFMKDLQRRADSMKNAMAKKPGGQQTSNTQTKNVNGKNETADIALPGIDTARIRKLPNKNLSLTELRSYITDLNTQITKKLSPTVVSAANVKATRLGNDPAKLELAAIAEVYHGSTEESVVLIMKAATQSNDGMLLTNAGGILDASGLSDKAIVILRTVVRHSPDNGVALNNLGQAFTSLGMHDSAMHYFSRCLSLSPHHPEANNTAGVIEFNRGNEDKAKAYFENSIRGGFTVSAYVGLKKIVKEKLRIHSLIKPKIKIPEYFNEFKYKLPAQCRNVAEAEQRKMEHKAFIDAIVKARNYYGKLLKEAERKNATHDPMKMNNEITQKVMKGESYLRPFQVMGAIVEAELLLSEKADREDLELFNTRYHQQYKQLEIEYKEKFAELMKQFEIPEDKDCCSEGDVSCCSDDVKFCRAMTQLKNTYLEKFAQLNDEWQSRNMLIEHKYLEDQLYWSYFAAINVDDARVRFYHHVVSYLRNVSRLAIVKTYEPCNVEETDEFKEPENPEITEMECPASLQIPFGIGKFQVDCEKVSFKAGEGIVIRYEHNYRSKQSTWSIGPGVELYDDQTPIAGIDVKLHMSAFVTVDQFGNVMDGGLISEAKATLSLGFERSEKLKFKEGAGWRLGYNTGLSMAPGRLRDLIDKTLGPPPEVYQNRNIRVYKPN